MHKYLTFFLTFFTLTISLYAEPVAGTLLEPYKDLLEQGTYEGQDWSSFDKVPLSRYDTFKMAFNHFEEIGGRIVVELGTTRSFTHGGHPGCNLDDPIFWQPDHPENWDWGAGSFTLMSAICLSHLKPKIYTIDLSPNHIQRCKVITSEYKDIISYHVCSSLDFLADCKFHKGIDLLYLDTGDMTPIEPTAILQLEEAKIIVHRNLLSKNGLLVIDDVRNQTPKKFGDTTGLGKSKYSLPYLLQNGFEIVADEYQVILKKKK